MSPVLLGLAGAWWASVALAAAAPLGPNDPTQALPAPAAPPSPALALPNAAPAGTPQDATTRLVLRGVKFDGAVALPEARLRPAWSGLEGKPVGLADLRGIGRRAEAIYTNAGFPFIAVVLRVQQVKDGIVHFDVVEGRISDLTVLGSNLTARRQATAALSPIVDRAPLSLGDVESAYQLAKAVPGLSIAGTLRRGSKPGGMDLVVTTQRDEWRTYVNFNDLYADTVGPWGVLVGADYFGPSEYGDQTSLQVYTSAPVGRQVLVRGSHARRLNATGTTVTISGLWGQANPKGVLAPLAIAEDVATLRLEVSQPLWERPDATALFDLALEGSNQRTRVFSTVGLSNDKLRVIDFTLSGEKRGAFGRLAASAEVRQGVDIAGASRPDDAGLSRVGADPQATVFRWGLEGETANFHRFRLAGRLDAQYSDRVLTVPDQYSVGNLTVGRGYQPGSALGDSAVAGSAEVRAGPFSASAKLQVEPFFFCDVMRLWNHGVAPFAERGLWSVGGGVRMQVAGKLHLDLVYAVPQDSPLGLGEPKPSPSVLLNVTVGLNDLFAAIHQRLASESGK